MWSKTRSWRSGSHSPCGFAQRREPRNLFVHFSDSSIRIDAR